MTLGPPTSGCASVPVFHVIVVPSQLNCALVLIRQQRGEDRVAGVSDEHAVLAVLFELGSKRAHAGQPAAAIRDTFDAIDVVEMQHSKFTAAVLLLTARRRGHDLAAASTDAGVHDRSGLLVAGKSERSERERAEQQ
jgi:hypothetical protein